MVIDYDSIYKFVPFDYFDFIWSLSILAYIYPWSYYLRRDAVCCQLRQIIRRWAGLIRGAKGPKSPETPIYYHRKCAWGSELLITVVHCLCINEEKFTYCIKLPF